MKNLLEDLYLDPLVSLTEPKKGAIISFFNFLKKEKIRTKAAAKVWSFVLDSGETVLIHARESARTSRFRLSWSTEQKIFLLSHPPFIQQREIDSFLITHQVWIQSTLKKTPEDQVVEVGDTFSFLGESWTLKFDPLRKKGVWKQGRELVIGQGVSDVNKAIEPILKKEAQERFKSWSAQYAEQLGATFSRVSIRDGRSRWGSCSASGTLSYSWRLGLAPLEVAQYVCAHEVAHLKEMNHSARFWSLVAQLDPSYKKHRAWLKREGGKLKCLSFVNKVSVSCPDNLA
ncbi:MAG: hypothetical protein A2977_02955 [Alphaproteobacteria bacterium RIFCSPLOWO2_01_FULL_45_8]|nr:MAG: hypothetical protein A2977_02955 [Alphaproteobacteria bacterium RIFCSPLOWO2_01_FULL_45_8]HCI48319.1 M48 family peptidase [Holosporales bacterium]